MTTLAFIINYNRLTLPVAMADYLASTPGIQPIIVDNASTYPPLLEYYEHSPHTVERMDANYGNCVVFHPESYLKHKYQLDNGQRFIITDPDLDLSGIPKDFLRLLHTGLDRYPWACKAGFSLETHGIPYQNFGAVMQWEAIHWSHKLDEHFYRADIDTTFCLCRGFVHDFPAVRTERPYIARHVPWHYTLATVPEDERYYLETAGKWSTYVNRMRS
jgi:hypothetical protein